MQIFSHEAKLILTVIGAGINSADWNMHERSEVLLRGLKNTKQGNGEESMARLLKSV